LDNYWMFGPYINMIYLNSIRPFSIIHIFDSLILLLDCQCL